MNFFKVTTLNINGIRAGLKKGFFDWVDKKKPDVVCLQETKANIDQLIDGQFRPSDYHCFFHSAQKKGYSGVAIYTKHEPRVVQYGIGWEDFDSEGRFLLVDFGKICIASIYLPSGTSKQVRQDFKMEILVRLNKYLTDIQKNGKEYILCGDWNIAHKKIDLKNWRGNQKNSGFLPEERAWMDELFGEMKFIDAFRTINSSEEQYTWWSNRGRAWDNNVGWRIDYQVITPGLKNQVAQEEVYKTQRFSDHAPLTISYALDSL